MKGNEKLLQTLNDLLADELTAISQLMVHSEMCDSWGYEKLHKKIEKQAIDEMHHAEWLIQRILFLEGMPIVSKVNEIKIGKTILEMFTNDESPNWTRSKPTTLGCAGWRSGRPIHGRPAVDDPQDGGRSSRLGKKQRIQIEQMGLENYLSNQAGEGE
jgi:bacterioferritin